jgi:hypothetical protein
MATNRHRSGSTIAGWTAIVVLGLAEVAIVSACALALINPTAAQGIDERFPFLENRQRRYQQQQQQQQQQPWGPQWNQQWGQEQRQAPAESTRAPAPRRPDVTPTVNVVVFGDSMSDWLAYGLEEAFAETPEVGVLRKIRANTGLIRVEQRGESYDWPTAARDILNADKPDFVVMLLGTADRRGIREAIRQPARPPAGQKQDQAKQAQPAPPAQATTPPAAEAQKPVDAEAPPPDTAQEQPSTAAESPIAGTVVHEFRSEKWGELYSRRIDEMTGVLKAKGVPVLWVGLPSIRGTRATSDAVYLNDLYRGRAEKAGITYVDIWDGFVDDAGNYSNYGADFEGQTRRLRTGDGVHFTRAGARKLAHYAEREIRRLMLARATPLATPAQEPEPEVDTKAPAAAAPGLPPRPIASPVMSLTAPRGAGDTLLGGAQSRSPGTDSVVQRVLVKGEAIEAPPGRADDFAWPRRDVVTATGVLPPDPVEPPTPQPAVAGGGAPAATAAVAPPRPAQPRPPREPRQQQQTTGWQPWGQQPWGQRQDPWQQRPSGGGGFFGGLFGNRW